MATYVFIESREHYKARFNKAAPKGFKPNKFYDKADGARMTVPKRAVVELRPMLILDNVEYESMMEPGKWITGRRQRREDMAKHGMVPWEPIDNRPRGFADRKFCKANNLPHSEAAEDWLKTKKKEAADKYAEYRKFSSGKVDA